MSVTLISPPDEVSFSADYINAKFACADHLKQDGAFAVNRILVTSSSQAPASYLLEWGNTSVLITGSDNPDNSGSQFPNTAAAGKDLAETALPYLQKNLILTAYFEIQTAPNSVLLFVAKKKGTGYDFKNFNITPGTTEKLKDNYTVYVKLMVQNAEDTSYTEAYSANLVLTNGTNEALAILGDKLHQRITADINRLGPEIPASSAMACKVSCRKYFFQYGESFGAQPVLSGLKISPVFTVLHGGFSTRAKGPGKLLSLIKPGAIAADKFLKQGALQVDTRADQPQYLYFFNTRVTVNATLNCRFYFTDGSVGTIALETLSLTSLSKYGFNVRLDRIFKPDDFPVKKVSKYEIWLSNASTTAAISESRFYAVDSSYREHFKYFLNWSSWGSLDTRMFYGKGSVEFDLVQSVAEKNKALPSDISKGTSIVYDISMQSKFSITTGFIKTKALLLLNRDFFSSKIKYVLSSGQLLPVQVTTKTIGEIEDDNKLYAQKFEYQYLFEDEAYTEGDIELPVDPPARILGQIYFGPSLTRPLTEADVLALPFSIAPSNYLILLPTGANRFMTVAFPSGTGGKDLGNAFDNTSQEDVTSEYISVAMTIDGQPYRVRTMEMAIPYSSNHDHIITAING
jgi:hypothetical protein